MMDRYTSDGSLIVYARIAQIRNLDDKIRQVEKSARAAAAETGVDFTSLRRTCVEWTPYMSVTWHRAGSR